MPAPSALTLAYQRQQQLLTVDMTAQIAQLWRQIDPKDVDKAWPMISKVLQQLVLQGYATSTQLAAAYLRSHAKAAGVNLSRVLVAPALSLQQLETALQVTGPVALKVASRAGQSPARAAQTALVRVSGSSTRLALAGGRGTLVRTISSGSDIVGYRRATHGHPCYFCALLASRGSVYKSEKNAEFIGDSAKQYHDHCSCTPEPLYSHQDDPPEVQNLYQRYLDATGGHSGPAAIKAWRQAYDGAA